MKLSEELFKLVKSLSSREKSYFKRYSGIYSSNPQKKYLKLFAALDKMDEYDESTLRKKLKDPKLLKHLSYEKSYLYKLLLRCLHSYDNEDSVIRKLKTRIDQVEVLMNRRLFSGALGILEKTLIEARETEHFAIWLDLIALKIRIYDYDWEAHRAETVHTLLEERARVMSLMENLDIYVGLRFLVFDLQDDGFVDRDMPSEKFRYLAEHPLLANPESALSKRALERYYYITNIMRFISRDFISWHSAYREYMFFMEANPQLFSDRRLFPLYSNFLFACVKVRDEQGFFGLLPKYEAMLSNNPHEYGAHKAVLISRKLDLFSGTGQFEKGMEVYQITQQEIHDWYDQIPEFSKRLLLISSTRTLLENHRYDDAIDVIREFLTLETNSMGPDLLVMRLFKSICYVELQQFSLLDTELRSLFRSLKKKPKHGPFEAQFLRFLGKLPQAVHNKDVIPLLLNMRNELAQMAEERSQNMILEYYHFIPWLDSKIKGRSFKEVTQEYLAEQSSPN